VRSIKGKLSAAVALRRRFAFGFTRAFNSALFEQEFHFKD
jgi:hypothetical protein